MYTLVFQDYYTDLPSIIDGSVASVYLLPDNILIDTKTVINSQINSSNLLVGKKYKITFSGPNVPTGTYYFGVNYDGNLIITVAVELNPILISGNNVNSASPMKSYDSVYIMSDTVLNSNGRGFISGGYILPNLASTNLFWDATKGYLEFNIPTLPTGTGATHWLLTVEAQARGNMTVPASLAQFFITVINDGIISPLSVSDATPIASTFSGLTNGTDLVFHSRDKVLTAQAQKITFIIGAFNIDVNSINTNGGIAIQASLETIVSPGQLA